MTRVMFFFLVYSAFAMAEDIPEPGLDVRATLKVCNPNNQSDCAQHTGEVLFGDSEESLAAAHYNGASTFEEDEQAINYFNRIEIHLTDSEKFMSPEVHRIYGSSGREYSLEELERDEAHVVYHVPEVSGGENLCLEASFIRTAEGVQSYFSRQLTYLPGDFDKDRDVDAVDFVQFRKAFGQEIPDESPAWLVEKNFFRDRVIDFADFRYFRMFYGTSTGEEFPCEANNF